MHVGSPADRYHVAIGRTPGRDRSNGRSTERSPTKIAANGAGADRGVYLRWFWNACDENRTFESPADDELIGAIVAHYDIVIAVWPDPDGVNGYSTLAIKTVEAVERDLRINSFMALDRETAIKWQAQFGGGSD
jgi:hypothetical protein